MTKPPKKESDFKEATAKLDAELEKIFEEVEEAVKKAGTTPEDFLPGLEILPDDYDESTDTDIERKISAKISSNKNQELPLFQPANNKEEESPLLSCDFDSTIARISPAATHLSPLDEIQDDLQEEELPAEELLEKELLTEDLPSAELLEKKLPEEDLPTEELLEKKLPEEDLPTEELLEEDFPFIIKNKQPAEEASQSFQPPPSPPSSVEVVASSSFRPRLLRLSLSPEELSELIEHAVGKGVAAALKRLKIKPGA